MGAYDIQKLVEYRTIASILTIMFNVHDPAPHGGFLVLPVVENGPLWVLAILIGAVVGGILFVAFKKYDFEKNQKAAPAAAAQPVEAPKAAAVEAPKAEAADFVKVENVFVAEDFASRDEALSFVSNQAVKAGVASDADAVMNAFLAREAEGTTGMMEGFAIPHAKSDAITEAAVIVVKDDSGVTGWDTMDGAPVNVAIALLIPGAQAGTTHLKILSKVAEGAHGRGLPCHRQGFHQRRRDRQDDQRPSGLTPRLAINIAPCTKGEDSTRSPRLFSCPSHKLR